MDLAPLLAEIAATTASASALADRFEAMLRACKQRRAQRDDPEDAADDRDSGAPWWLFAPWLAGQVPWWMVLPVSDPRYRYRLNQQGGTRPK